MAVIKSHWIFVVFIMCAFEVLFSLVYTTAQQSNINWKFYLVEIKMVYGSDAWRPSLSTFCSRQKKPNILTLMPT